MTDQELTDVVTTDPEVRRAASQVAASKSSIYEKLEPDLRRQVEQDLTDHRFTVQAVFKKFNLREGHGISRASFFRYARKIRYLATIVNQRVMMAPTSRTTGGAVNLINRHLLHVLMDDRLNRSELNSVTLALARTTKAHLALETQQSRLRSLDAAYKTKAVVTMEKLNNEMYEAGYDVAIAELHLNPANRDKRIPAHDRRMDIPPHLADPPWQDSNLGSDPPGMDAPDDAAINDAEADVSLVSEQRFSTPYDKALAECRDRMARRKAAGEPDYLTGEAWEVAMKRRAAATKAYLAAKGLPPNSDITTSPTTLDLDPATSPPPEIRDPNVPGAYFKADKQLWESLMRQQFPASQQSPAEPRARDDVPDIATPPFNPWHPRDIPPRPRRPNPSDSS